MKPLTGKELASEIHRLYAEIREKSKEIAKLKELVRNRLNENEQRIKSLEIKTTHVPCCIEEDFKGLIICEEPFCKFVYYNELAEKARHEWLAKAKQALGEGKL